MLYFTSVHSRIKPHGYSYLSGIQLSVWLSVYKVWLFFSRKFKYWRKYEIMIRKILGSCIQVQIFFFSFLNKYFIEVEELLAMNSANDGFLHSSIYQAPACGAQHLLLQATLIFQEWCLTLSPCVVFQSMCGTWTCYSPAIVDGRVCCIIIKKCKLCALISVFC